LSGCSSINTQWFTDNEEVNPTYISYAQKYVGMDEYSYKSELETLMGIDPISIQWCAAFVNAVLNESGVSGSESISDTPLLARSFLNWGERVDIPKKGDIVVFPRGNQEWQGHVGFYVDTIVQDGVEYYLILGGNQSNKVSYDLYLAESALSIRRMKE